MEELINSLSIYFQVENNLIFKISIILVFVFFKNTIQLFNQYNVTKFSFNLENTLATRIINKILGQNLIEDNNSKSTDFIKKTSSDTQSKYFLFNPFNQLNYRFVSNIIFTIIYYFLRT